MDYTELPVILLSSIKDGLHRVASKVMLSGPEAGVHRIASNVIL
jgi:hypothetical protein